MFSFDSDDEIYDDLEGEIDSLDDLLDEYDEDVDIEELIKALDDEDLYEDLVSHKRVDDRNLTDGLSKLLDNE